MEAAIAKIALLYLFVIGGFLGYMYVGFLISCFFRRYLGHTFSKSAQDWWGNSGANFGFVLAWPVMIPLWFVFRGCKNQLRWLDKKLKALCAKVPAHD